MYGGTDAFVYLILRLRPMTFVDKLHHGRFECREYFDIRTLHLSIDHSDFTIKNLS